MFAVSGFGQEFPVLVYVYERTKLEVEQMFFISGGLQSANANTAVPDNKSIDNSFERKQYNQDYVSFYNILLTKLLN